MRRLAGVLRARFLADDLCADAFWAEVCSDNCVKILECDELYRGTYLLFDCVQCVRLVGQWRTDDRGDITLQLTEIRSSKRKNFLILFVKTFREEMFLRTWSVIGCGVA